MDKSKPRLTPEQRIELAKWLTRKAREQNRLNPQQRQKARGAASRLLAANKIGAMRGA